MKVNNMELCEVTQKAVTRYNVQVSGNVILLQVQKMSSSSLLISEFYGVCLVQSDCKLLNALHPTAFGCANVRCVM